jgi:hypothetical protein
MAEPNGGNRCPTCAGCGAVANDDDRTPWKYWAELPAPSNLAVRLGIVRPEPCQDCGGTGVRRDERGEESVCDAFARLAGETARRIIRCDDAEAAYPLELVTRIDDGRPMAEGLFLIRGDGIRVRLWPPPVPAQ